MLIPVQDGSSPTLQQAVAAQPDVARPRPAVFLDRDGVLNARKLTLVRRPDQLVILPGLASAVKRLCDAGFVIVIATNQEFVGHGYIKPEDHSAVMAQIVTALEAEGGRVEGVYACVHPRGSNCHDQKPKPGMLLDAARDLNLDLGASYMVGDNRKDMQAGKAAGTRTVLVDPRFRTWVQGAEGFADHVCPALPHAAEWILADSGRLLLPSALSAPAVPAPAPAPEGLRPPE